MQFTKPITIVSALILPLVVAQQVPAVNLPTCAYSPLLSVITNFGCQIEPRNCYCTKAEAPASIAAAVIPACSGSINEAGVSSFVSSFCAAGATTITGVSEVDTTITRQSTVTQEFTTTIGNSSIAETADAAAPTPTETTVSAEPTITEAPPSTTEEPSASDDTITTGEGPPEDQASKTEEPPVTSEPTSEPSSTDSAVAAFTTAEASSEEEDESSEQPPLTTASLPANFSSPTDTEDSPPAQFTGGGNVGVSMAALAGAVAGLTWVFGEL
jgi:hypothetical protein